MITSKQNYRKGIVVLTIVVGTILLIQTFHKAYRVQGYDFTSYLLSAEALLQQKNPYTLDTVFPYIYPLFLAFTLIPLSVIPYGAANLIWFVLNASALCAVANRHGSYVETRWLARISTFIIDFPGYVCPDP